MCTVTEDNCDRIVRSGLVQYALDVFDVKSNSTNNANPKILSSALDTLVHITNTSTAQPHFLIRKIKFEFDRSLP